MSYDDWVTREPQEEYYVSDDDEVPVCFDCGAPIDRAVKSVITDADTARVYCEPCYRHRAAEGRLFDPRPLGAVRRRA